jgi:hypothetical protein
MKKVSPSEKNGFKRQEKLKPRKTAMTPSYATSQVDRRWIFAWKRFADRECLPSPSMPNR